MCLIALAWRQHAALPLLLLANRDEFRQRPTAPAAHWSDPPILAGRDLQAGGSWLGLAPDGRFAALTNVRRPGTPTAPRSRGEWIALALTLPQEALLARLQADAGQYGPFNLLWGSPAGLWAFHSPGARLQVLQPGIHALSNADLDTPWPKVEHARAGLAAVLAEARPDVFDGRREPLWQALAATALADDVVLPDTGIGADWERRLAPPMITGPGYGTRSRNLLLWHADGSVEFEERQVDADGAVLEARRFRQGPG